MKMLKREQVKDERIIGEHHKQNSEAFGILYWGLLLDVFYRSVIMRQEISQFGDIALLFFGISFYLVIRNVNTGIVYYEDTRKVLRKILPITLIAAVTGTATMVYLDAAMSIGQMVLTFITYIAGFGITIYLIYWLSSKKANRVEDD